MKCDFCARPAVWNELARDITFPLTTHGEPMALLGTSTGGWASCPECHVLIAHGERQRLTHRGTDATLRSNELVVNAFRKGLITRPEVSELVHTIHQKFWEARTGKSVLLSP